MPFLWVMRSRWPYFLAALEPTYLVRHRGISLCWILDWDCENNLWQHVCMVWLSSLKPYISMPWLPPTCLMFLWNPYCFILWVSKPCVIHLFTKENSYWVYPFFLLVSYGIYSLKEEYDVKKVITPKIITSILKMCV